MHQLKKFIHSKTFRYIRQIDDFVKQSNAFLTSKTSNSTKICPSYFNLKPYLGANLTLDCEAKGFPAPTITWQYDNVEGETILLPRSPNEE